MKLTYEVTIKATESEDTAYDGEFYVGVLTMHHHQ